MDDPRFQDGWARTKNYEALEPILTEAMKARTTKEWVEELEQARLPCGPVNNIEQVAKDPQVADRGMITEIHHPKAGSFRVVNSPFKFSRTPCGAERTCPDLGEHTEEVLKELLAINKQDVDRLRKSGII